MYLGQISGKPCRISPTSPNHSIIISGISGSGKSCKQNLMELQAVKEGNTIIVIDYSQNHQPQFLLSSIAEEYNSYINRIDAVKDGINLNLLLPIIQNGKRESSLNVISGNIVALSMGNSMGVKQKSALRTILEQAIKNFASNQDNESEALISAFDMYKENLACQEVYQKLYTFLHSNVLRQGNKKKIEAGKINIFDLKELDIQVASIVSEIILAYLWRLTFNIGLPKEWNKVICSLDEFQHLSIKKDSTLRTILREGRRFNLSLLLATQTLSIFNTAEIAMLNQTATRLLFRPNDNDLKKIAQTIDFEQTNYWKNELSNLQVGECIAIGNKNVCGCEISRPLKLTSEVIL